MLYWEQLGVIRYPLAIVGVFLAVQIVRGVLDVSGSRVAAEGGLRTHSILLWGVLGAAIGVLGTLVGLMQMAGFIEQAGGVSPALAWGGFKVALSSSVVGLLMLGLAAIAWLVLQYIQGRREPELA